MYDVGHMYIQKVVVLNENLACQISLVIPHHIDWLSYLVFMNWVAFHKNQSHGVQVFDSPLLIIIIIVKDYSMYSTVFWFPEQRGYCIIKIATTCT